jgi:hypothetical protein
MRKTKRIKMRETKKQKRIKKLLLVSKKLTKQKHKHSKKNVCGPFPYMFIITFINNNIFINLTDLQGKTKV